MARGTTVLVAYLPPAEYFSASPHYVFDGPLRNFLSSNRSSGAIIFGGRFRTPIHRLRVAVAALQSRPELSLFQGLIVLSSTVI